MPFTNAVFDTIKPLVINMYMHKGRGNSRELQYLPFNNLAVARTDKIRILFNEFLVCALFNQNQSSFNSYLIDSANRIRLINSCRYPNVSLPVEDFARFDYIFVCELSCMGSSS